jgi:hypothetical protein
MDNGPAKASPTYRSSGDFLLQLIDGALALAEGLFRDMESRRRANVMLHEAASIPTRISTCAKEPDIRRKLKLRNTFLESVYRSICRTTRILGRSQGHAPSV